MQLAPLSLLPKGALTILREIGRHLLRRPVVGILVVARTDDGGYVLVRRADTGTWAFPGGTVEWGETLRSTYPRELEEEAGVTESEFRRVIGVFSDPERDPRFHAVTVAVECRVALPTKQPINPLEIREVGIFHADAMPSLAMRMDDVFRAAQSDGPCHLE